MQTDHDPSNPNDVIFFFCPLALQRRAQATLHHDLKTKTRLGSIDYIIPVQVLLSQTKQNGVSSHIDRFGQPTPIPKHHARHQIPRVPCQSPRTSPTLPRAVRDRNLQPAMTASRRPLWFTMTIRPHLFSLLSIMTGILPRPYRRRRRCCDLDWFFGYCLVIISVSWYGIRIDRLPAPSFLQIDFRQHLGRRGIPRPSFPFSFPEWECPSACYHRLGRTLSVGDRRY